MRSVRTNVMALSRVFQITTIVIMTVVAIATGFTDRVALGQVQLARSEASQRLDDYVGAGCRDAATPDTRTQGAAALYHIAYDHDYAAAASSLQREMAAQDLDPSSQAYGGVINPATPSDANDTVFAAQAWGPILLRYSDVLPKATVGALRSHAAAALLYFQHHPTSVDYTNITLLTASEDVLLGDALNDDDAQRRGLANLAQWVAAVRDNGIHEFESPTYFAVDIDALEEGATFGSQGQREPFAAALRYVWREIGANLFLPRGRIAGAQSRSYDVLYGSDAPIEMKLWYEAIGNGVHDSAALRCLDVYSVLHDGATSHHNDVMTEASAVPRIVEQRWSADAQATKYTYVTDGYAIGSSNEDYDQTDRVAQIDLRAGPARIVPIRMLADKTGYWFSPTPNTQSDGERRWDHVLTRPASVQFENLMLVINDIDGSAAADGGPLTLNILFPATGDGLLVGGVRVHPSTEKPIAIRKGDAVGIRVGDTTAAARIVYADRAATGDAPLSLETTEKALRAGVVRLEALQAPFLPSGKPDLRSVVLLAAQSGRAGRSIIDKLQQARVTSHDSDGVWHVQASLDGHSLEIDYDLTTHRSIHRECDGKAVFVRAPFSVNGTVRKI